MPRRAAARRIELISPIAYKECWLSRWSIFASRRYARWRHDGMQAYESIEERLLMISPIYYYS